MSSDKEPFEISECDNPVVLEAFRYFCRHLVCLGATVQDLDERGRDKGAMRSIGCSAFVLVIRDTWYLMTAGHCMKDIEKGQKQGLFRLVDTYLMAGFGPEVKAHQAAELPIYFDYENTWKDYIYQDGLDFGLLNLGKEDEYLRMHLEKNEVQPVQEENWRVPPGQHFDHFIVLGFPKQFTERGLLRPVMVFVHRLVDLPEHIEKKPWRTFTGKIGDNLRLESMEGLSGGPIFGFKNDVPDKYWIVAIQSEWLKNSKITLACSVPMLAQFAELAIHGDVQIKRQT